MRPQVDEVKGIMTENIDKMLLRGEKLELLTDKTENLMFEVGGIRSSHGRLRIMCALAGGGRVQGRFRKTSSASG